MPWTKPTTQIKNESVYKRIYRKGLIGKILDIFKPKYESMSMNTWLRDNLIWLINDSK